MPIGVCMRAQDGAEVGVAGDVQPGSAPGSQPDGGPLPTLLVAGGVAAMCAMALRAWRRRARADRHRPVTPAEVVREATWRPGTSQELDRRSAEAVELVRQMSAVLDTKAARLEALIAKADERIDAARSVGAEGSRRREGAA